MSRSLSPHRLKTCHCGHDKSSHYQSNGICLVVGGCPCQEYVHEDDPPPKKPLRKPNHPAKQRDGRWEDCQCYECKKYWKAVQGHGGEMSDEDKAPDTPKMPWGVFPWGGSNTP